MLMQDTSLYQRILGLSDPWSVGRVELNVAEQRVDLWVEHQADASWKCPVCQASCPLYDHAGERRWRHLDTCQFQTHLHARIPRINCPAHGVLNVAVPWGARNSRFTLLLERLIIDLLLACQNVQSVCRLLRISWSAAAQVMDRAVARGLLRKQHKPIKYVGVDEKAFQRGHHYLTVVSDLEAGSVEYLAEHRTSESLAGYYQQLPQEIRQGIEAVAMDMHQPYVQATFKHLAEGESKIVFDRFHIMKKANEALDQVRKSEQLELSRRKDDRLLRTRQMWLWGQENLPQKYQDRFKALKDQDLKTAKAWALKEHLRHLWRQADSQQAREFFKHWQQWAKGSKLPPMVRLARTLKTRLNQIVSYCRHPITSAGCEGLNSKITSVKIRAAGYRNLERFKNAIFFYCGKLQLYP
jgi:transposase